MIAVDKILHILAGATIGFTAALLFGWIVAVVMVIAAAVGKELYDRYHLNHTVEVYDALATVIGGIYALIIFAAHYTS